MGQSGCLMADLISYCLCCCLTPLLENCTVQGMPWREWQVKMVVLVVVVVVMMEEAKCFVI